MAETKIWRADYEFQQQFCGQRLDIYKRLARAGEVLYQCADFNELKNTIEEVPLEDRAGIDAICKYATVDNVGAVTNNPLRVSKLQCKAIRADKVKFGYNITVALDDLDKLDNIDLYLQMFEVPNAPADFVVVDAKALKQFILDNRETIDMSYTRYNKTHSTVGFMWLPIERRIYRPPNEPIETRFGLPPNSIMLSSPNIWDLCSCANFNVPELKIARSGQ